ncbi:TIR domain-containing protein [Verrucomicrobium sp. GAS474]|uniref:TIR domain-containing protein n=1 Tax=Verrucomicrobium sp. GAS474 TaxID=1882831 RepID=UPI00087B6470|nr:TIR domain-containing protein [Verrucomicrobium sp. GAS474]SDT90433.1 TIR domain-containing protein [Verrucomicrobium sp. GAS474]
MFSLLIAYDPTAWETDQVMRMDADRFKEYTDGAEAQAVSLEKPKTLKLLEEAPALLMYEGGPEASREIVRYGTLRNIHVTGQHVTFRFTEKGRFTRADILEFSRHLSMGHWEENRTHWAIKDGDLPAALLKRLQSRYDVVLSFAGEDREYVQATADYLIAEGIHVFYDTYDEANLWGKNLAEHFEWVYRNSSAYCVMFISKWYVKKIWTILERRSAVARAIAEDKEYILPARFDNTEVPNVLPTVKYVSLKDKTPQELGELIVRKLRHPSVTGR